MQGAMRAEAVDEFFRLLGLDSDEARERFQNMRQMKIKPSGQPKRILTRHDTYCELNDAKLERSSE